MRHRELVLAVLLLTVIVRCGWLRAFPPDPIGPVDAVGFHLLAENWLAGRGLAIAWDAPFCPTAIRPPLYPFFIASMYAVLGVQPLGVVLAHVLLEVLTAALVMRLGRDLAGAKAGALAGVLYALNGSTQRYTGYLLAEALLLPLLAAALLATVYYLRTPSSKSAAGAALWWGLALLTKPNVQFLVLAVGGLMTLRALWPPAAAWRERVRWGVTFWLVLGVLLAPWVVRNRVVLGRWLLSTAFEENLARVSAVATLAQVEEIQAEPWTETWEYLYGRIVSTAAALYVGSPAGCPPRVCGTSSPAPAGCPRRQRSCHPPSPRLCSRPPLGS